MKKEQRLCRRPILKEMRRTGDGSFIFLMEGLCGTTDYDIATPPLTSSAQAALTEFRLESRHYRQHAVLLTTRF
jgi:hypothetical protein